MGKAVGKILKVGALVAGAAAIVVSGGLGAGLAGIVSGVLGGLGATSLGLIATGLTLGASLLAPKPKAPSASPSSADRLFASIDARTPRKIVFGTTAMATDIRDQEYGTGQDYFHRFIVVASHKVAAISELWFDDKRVWTVGGGVEGDAVGYLTVTPVLEGNASNAINISPRMGSSRRFTGCAYVHLRYKLTGNNKKTDSPYAQSIPSRITIRGNGAFVYDPRLDSSVGGSGSQRASDQTTWAWSDSASRNPVLELLWYLLGWRIQNPSTGAWKLAVGKGIPPARIDLVSFITAANLCDESVALAAGGSEPRYRSDGIFSEADAPQLVLDNLKAAMNATLDDIDGKIRLTVLSNDLATPIAAFTENDIIGEVRWDQSPPLNDTFNIIRGGYTDPSDKSLYQLVDYPEIALASIDGIERIETVNYPLVQSPSQAQRLSKQRLQRMQYPGMFTATFQATAWRIQKGDVVTLTFAPLGWVNKLFRAIDLTVQVDGTVPMILREENAAIYAWSASEVAAVQAAAPTTYNALLAPVTQDIAIIQSDAWLSAGEKPDIIREYGDAAAERDALVARGIAAGYTGDPGSGDPVEAYAGAFADLQTYLAGLAPAWNDTTKDTPILPATFNAKFGAYAAARTALLNGIVSKAVAAANTAASNAATAKTNADNALAAIAIIQSDGYLSAGEKPDIIRQVSDIAAEYSDIVAKATALSVSSTTYASAYSALNTYLATLSPAYTNTSADTAITAATFNGKFSDYYFARTALLNAIAAKAATLATWAGTTGPGKPEDNATRNEGGSNLIPAPVKLERSVASGSAAFSLGTSGSANRDFNRFLLSGATEGNVTWEGPNIGCVPGETLFFEHWLYEGTTGSTGTVRGVLDFYAQDKTYIVSVFISPTSVGTGGVWKQFKGQGVAPAGAAWVSPRTQRLATSSGSVYAADPYLGRQERGSDITLSAQTTATMSVTEKTVQADYLGVVSAGQTPTFQAAVKQAGSSVSGSSQASYTLSNQTGGSGTGAGWSVDNTDGSASKGMVTFNGDVMNANAAGARLVVSYAGTAIAQFDMKVNKQLAAAPSSGTGGGGGGGGSGTKSATVQANASTTSTSHSPISNATNPQLTVATGEQLYASASLTYTLFGGAVAERYGYFKHQYSADGSSWTDFASETIGQSTRRTGGTEPETYDGSITLNQSVSVSAGTYYVRTLWRLDAGGRTVTLNGENAVYEAKA